MNAEVIAIGDELLIGQVTDTNSGYIARQLNRHGIELIRVTQVRDRAKEITAAVNESLSRVSVVLLTGGLGPTKDDITKTTLCEIFGGKLVYSEQTQASNDALFARQGKVTEESSHTLAKLADLDKAQTYRKIDAGGHQKKQQRIVPQDGIDRPHDAFDQLHCLSPLSVWIAAKKKSRTACYGGLALNVQHMGLRWPICR